MTDLWVFGYASLMWRPGFVYAEKARARLSGYHRSLCIRSFEHRGTPERPGLVMGLDRGGACVGLAFRIEAGHREDVLAYLRARELVTHVYRERVSPVSLEDGRRVHAVAYVADRAHRQYAGRLSLDEAVGHVRGAVGNAGPNEDYVINTAAHLAELGIEDPWLAALAERLANTAAV